VNAKLRHVSEKGCHHELTTPLIAAVYYDQQEFIKSLVAIFPPTPRTQSARVATAGSDTGIPNRSLENGEMTDLGSEALDINCSNMLGQTPLMYAASRGNEAIVLFLLQLHADRNMRDGNGEKASDWAKKQNHQSVYMLLICDPLVSSVHAAIREGNVEATVAYFKQNPNPNQRWFLNHTYSSSFASSSASSTRGASDVSTSRPTLDLQSAVNSGTMAIEGVLDGEPPLVVAAKFNRIAIINILLRAPGIDIDIVDTFGKTPLMHAAESGHEESILLLLKHKANRYAMDYTQQTAVHHASRGQHVGVVAILEADPYKVYVHDACESGDVSYFRFDEISYHCIILSVIATCCLQTESLHHSIIYILWNSSILVMFKC
jgi:ankyrin repeat protein